MLRRSAVSTITFGLSTWQVTTSTPWSIRLLAASASLTGRDQSPVTISCVVIFGSTVRAPIVNALMFRSTWGIGLAAMKPSFFVLLVWPADSVQVLAFVDVAEVAADVLGMLALGPEAAAVREPDLRVLLGHAENVRIEVAERRREQQGRAVLL